MNGGKTVKKVCAVLALLLLFCFLCTPVNAGTGSVRVLDPEGKDITKDNHEEGDSGNKPHPSDDKEDEDEQESENVEDPKDSGLWESSINAFRTAVSGGFEDFTNLIIDQLMSGSVTIFETETTTEDETQSGLITYKIKNKAVEPFGPEFVRTSIIYTGGFYLLVAAFVILGSYIMLLIYNHRTEQFVDMMAAITGEERPYDTNMQTFASVGAGVLWIVTLALVFLIAGFRNIVVYSIAPHEVVLPSLYVDSIPNKLLTGVASYNNALQSSMSEYGIHMFAAISLVITMITIIILGIGAVRGATYFYVFSMGIYTLFNFIDIINMGSLSVGIQLYLANGDPQQVINGLIFGGGLNLFILIILIYYAATRIGRAMEEL